MSDVLVILAQTCVAEHSTFGNICSECLERGDLYSCLVV